MTKRYIFDFLRDLRNNNSKEWMDENRERYHHAKDTWIAEIKKIQQRLIQHDSIFENVPPKSTLSRINNNRRFHQDKPIYKDFFTCTPSSLKGRATFHISIGPGQSFIGGGIYRPDKDTLDKVRAAIDYNGQDLKEVIEKPSLVDYYGGLAEDDQKLKTSPQGYDIEHQHIELLRRKNFVAIRPVTNEEFTGEHFIDLVEEGYLAVKPLLDYLNQAIQFEE